MVYKWQNMVKFATCKSQSNYSFYVKHGHVLISWPACYEALKLTKCGKS